MTDPTRTDHLPTLGEVAYLAFVDQLHAAHSTTRNPHESGWHRIGDTVRQMWEAAGVAAARAYLDRPLAHDIGRTLPVIGPARYALPEPLVVGWPGHIHWHGPRGDVVAEPADAPGHQQTGTC